MKFESKYELGQLIEFDNQATPIPGTAVDEHKILGTITQVKFKGDGKVATYDIAQSNTKNCFSDVEEKNITKAFRSIT